MLLLPYILRFLIFLDYRDNMLQSKTSKRLAFNDPLKVNNVLFMNSGKQYAGARWLGFGNETGSLRINRDIMPDTTDLFSGLLGVAKGLKRRFYKDRFLSLLVLFITHNPE